MSEQSHVFSATEENFPELVAGNSRKGPVLADFRAKYAGPSLRQRELLSRLVREYGGRLLLVPLADRIQRAAPTAEDPRIKRYRQALFDL